MQNLHYLRNVCPRPATTLPGRGKAFRCLPEGAAMHRLDACSGKEPNRLAKVIERAGGQLELAFILTDADAG